MTVDEALAWADANGHAPEVRDRLRSRAVAWTLAAEVRRLRPENARLRQAVADLEDIAGHPYIELRGIGD